MNNNTEEIKFNEIDERIERFLRGEMTPDEEVQFREELKNDANLREHARAVSALIKGLQEQGLQHDQEIINELAVHNKPNNLRRLILWTLSAAAVVALYFGYSYHAENVRYAQVNEMLTPYYEHYDPNSLSRGETDSVTIAHLYSLFNRIPDEKNMKDIIAELEPIYDSLDSDYIYYPYANDIAWNLALAYVKSGEEDKAKDILNDLCSLYADSPIVDKAKRLLEKLNPH